MQRTEVLMERTEVLMERTEMLKVGGPIFPHRGAIILH